MKIKKKYIIIPVVVIAIILILVIPIQKQYPDGGTIIYRALTYCKIEWNVKMGYNNTYITGEEYHIFPNNFKSYEEYFKVPETATLGLTTEPIQIYCVDGEERTIKMTNLELMDEIIEGLNSASYTHLRKATEEEAAESISVYIRNVSKEVFYIELVDAHTVNLEGQLYQSDKEIPYELLKQLLIENN